MDTVAGKMPVADSISSARNWIPVTDIYVGVPEHDSEGKVKLDDKNKPILTKADPHLFVPRPDKNYSTLWWLSVIPFTGLLGIDHLYLRSPWTAMIKMFTIGGFGIWYLWDAVQLSTEKERVMNYGLSAPFDAITGIAQGMLEDTGKSTYEQTTNYGVWFFLTLFGFTGFDSILMGRTWLGIHKFLICVIILTIVIPSVTVGGSSFFGLLALIFFIPEIIGLVVGWGSDASRLLLKPNSIMKEGLPVPDTAYNGFAWFKSLYVDKAGNSDSPESAETWERLKEHYIFKKEGLTAAELRSRFWIGRAGEIASPTETKEEPTIIPDSFPPVTIMLRLFYVLGTWIVLGVNVGMAIAFPANIAIKANAMVSAKMAEAQLKLIEKGGIPGGLPGGLPSGLPGGLPSGLPGGLPGGLPSGLPGSGDLTKGLPSSPPGLPGDLTKGLPGPITGDKGAASPSTDSATTQAVAPAATQVVAPAAPSTATAAPSTTKNNAANEKNIDFVLKTPQIKQNPLTPESLQQASLGYKNRTGQIPLTNREQSAAIAAGRPAAAAAGGARPQLGGARKEELSSEAQIMAATVVALIAGGSLKGLVDFLMLE
jgi:hypothetical protein